MTEVVQLDWSGPAGPRLLVASLPLSTNSLLYDLPMEHAALLQPTGHQDRNGVDIFEGHILDLHDSLLPKPVVVEWNEHYAAFLTTGIDYLSMLECRSYEVLSDIYQNPDIDYDDCDDVVARERQMTTIPVSASKTGKNQGET